MLKITKRLSRIIAAVILCIFAIGVNSVNAADQLHRLIKQLEDNHWENREAAVRGLGKFQDPKALKALIETLKDSHWRIRRAAARAISTFQNPVSQKLKINIEFPGFDPSGYDPCRSIAPLRVYVQSSITENNYVKKIMVITDGNPNARVATFNFTPMLGVVDVSTYIRVVGGPQYIIAVAELSNGRFVIAKRRLGMAICCVDG